MQKRKILGALMFIAGIIFLASSQSGITGNVISERAGGVGSILGLVLIVGGVLVMASSRQAEWDKYRIEMIANEYDQERLNPIQAVLKINDRLYPKGIEITGVTYRSSNPVSVQIQTKNQIIPLKLSEKDKAIDLAIGAYEMAIINDRKNKSNCELHISKTASSKHHKEGLQKIIDRFEEKYKEDIKPIK